MGSIDGTKTELLRHHRQDGFQGMNVLLYGLVLIQLCNNDMARNFSFHICSFIRGIIKPSKLRLLQLGFRDLTSNKRNKRRTNT